MHYIVFAYFEWSDVHLVSGLLRISCAMYVFETSFIYLNYLKVVDNELIGIF